MPPTLKKKEFFIEKNGSQRLRYLGNLNPVIWGKCTLPTRVVHPFSAIINEFENKFQV